MRMIGTQIRWLHLCWSLCKLWEHRLDFISENVREVASPLPPVSNRLTIFGLQRQPSRGWRLIYANYCPRYNLAGTSNSTFSSKIIASVGLLIDNWHITYHWQSNQCEKHFRTKVKSHTSHGSCRSHPPCSNACHRIQIPSLILSAYLKSFLSHQAVCALGLRCIVDVEFSRWRRRSRNFPGYMLYISIDNVLFWERYSLDK